MAIGMNISEKVCIELGEYKEQLLHDLDINKIKYTIPFDKTNKQNVKETIITIADLGVEVSVENDIVTYIKSAFNEYSSVDSLPTDTEINVLEHIQKIKEKIQEKFQSEEDRYKIKIERIDSETMFIMAIISNAYEKARITILMTADNNIFINTIRLLA